MRTHDEHTPHASPSLGVRQFNVRATSSANRFLPTPSSPANSNAPGKRPDVIIRLSESLTRAFPVKSLNIRLISGPNCLALSGTTRQLLLPERVFAPLSRSYRSPLHVPVPLPRSANTRYARVCETPHARC